MKHWSEETLAVFDLETTGTNPRQDRIVEAAFVLVDPDGSVSRHSFREIVNPGIEIPKEASDVHGITTERARAEGVDAEQAVKHLASLFQLTHRFGRPVVIYNAPFDWPMMLAECDRYGVDIPRDVLLIDPLVLDRHFDRYRKGGRKLEAVARYYGIELANAHSAYADAVATAGVARALCTTFPELKEYSLAELQELQRRWHAEWVASMNDYFARIGRQDRVTGSWPGTDVLEESAAS